jgi:hypothetical protein
MCTPPSLPLRIFELATLRNCKILLVVYVNFFISLYLDCGMQNSLFFKIILELRSKKSEAKTEVQMLQGLHSNFR